jgi:hypothetical protein
MFGAVVLVTCVTDYCPRRPRKVCDVRAEAGERHRAEFLDAISAGASVEDAARAASWTSRTTYPTNRRRFPAW